MRILSIAYPFAAVRTDSVGGAEQVLRHLDEALVRNSYPSVVIASAGSKVSGTLVELPIVEGEITPAARETIYDHLRTLIAKTADEFNPHLLHMHGVDFYQYLPADDHLPVLVTLHLPVNYYPSSIFHPRRQEIYLMGVSRTQQRACPESDHLLPPITNGVSVPFDYPCPKRDYTVCLSRIAPEKNSHAALEAARQAGLPCLLAGKVFNYPEHQDYFACKVQPLLDQSRRFIGAIDEPQKWALLASARCLLQPSLAEETSSLVAMESLACGTPVVAMACGALPEIIEEGKTGFLVHSTAEMAEAISKVQRLNPQDCLTAARERFSLQRMTKEYFEVYHKLARSEFT